jgi:hypothetical protein
MKKFITVKNQVVLVESSPIRRPKEEKYFVIYNGKITRKGTQKIGSTYNNNLVALDCNGYAIGHHDKDNNFIVDNYLKSWSEIEQQILEKNKGKKIILAINDENNIYFLTLNLSSLIKYRFLFQLNVKNNKTCGICFRYFSKYNDLYFEIAENVQKVSLENFIDILEIALNIDNNCNFGNIAEYFLSHNIKDLTDEKFRSKKADLYIKVTSKNNKEYKKPVELKTSLNLKCDLIKTSKSNSITNNFILL